MWLLWVVAGVDVAENVYISVVAAGGGSSSSWIFVLSATKWATLGFLGVLLMGAFVRKFRAQGGTGDDDEEETETIPRLLWRFRVQIGVVGLFAFLVAVP